VGVLTALSLGAAVFVVAGVPAALSLGAPLWKAEGDAPEEAAE
jgi:hypothetical protein